MAKRKEEQKPPPAPDESPGAEQPFPISGYVWLNLFFWAFCALEVLIVWWWLKDIQGVFFFFMLLALGFTVVSIYDCVYDRVLAPLSEAPEPGEDSPTI